MILDTDITNTCSPEVSIKQAWVKGWCVERANLYRGLAMWKGLYCISIKPHNNLRRVFPFCKCTNWCLYRLTIFWKSSTWEMAESGSSTRPDFLSRNSFPHATQKKARVSDAIKVPNLRNQQPKILFYLRDVEHICVGEFERKKKNWLSNEQILKAPGECRVEDKRSAKEYIFKYMYSATQWITWQHKGYRTILMPKGLDKSFACICDFSFSSYGCIIPAINKRRLFILK